MNDGPDHTPRIRDADGYWRATKRLTIALLVIWFAVSYGCGILLRDTLDAWSVGGAPLGLWFAQQGSIYVFVVLIFVYCAAMRRIERRYSTTGDAGPDEG